MIRMPKRRKYGRSFATRLLTTCAISALAAGCQDAGMISELADAPDGGTSSYSPSALDGGTHADSQVAEVDELDWLEDDVGSSQGALSSGSIDASGPLRDAVVNINGCTGTLVRHDIVLTAGHCTTDTSGPSSTWNTVPSMSGFVGRSRSAPTATFTTNTLNHPGNPPNCGPGGSCGVDQVLLRITGSISRDIAAPARVRVSNPQFSTSTPLRYVGWGQDTSGAAQPWRLTTSGFWLEEPGRNGDANTLRARMANAGPTWTPGDSGGPAFWTNSLGREILVGSLIGPDGTCGGATTCATYVKTWGPGGFNTWTPPASVPPVASWLTAQLPCTTYACAWESMPGNATDIAVRGSSPVMGAWIITNTPNPYGYTIARWNGTTQTWTPISGGATRVGVDNNGRAWVVNSFGDIYQYNGSAFVWVPGGATDIAVGGVGASEKVWIVGTLPAPQGGNQIYRRDGSSWTLIPGGGSRIAVDETGKAWVVNANSNVFRYTGTGASGWTWVPGRQARDIAVGADGTVWIVGTDNIVYRYRESTSTWVATTQTNALAIGAGFDGYPWVVQQNNAIRRNRDVFYLN